MKTTWQSRHPTYGYVLSNFWTKLCFYISTSGSTGGNVSANVKTFAYNFWPNTIRWSSPEFPKRNKKEKTKLNLFPCPASSGPRSAWRFLFSSPRPWRSDHGWLSREANLEETIILGSWQCIVSHPKFWQVLVFILGLFFLFFVPMKLPE